MLSGGNNQPPSSPPPSPSPGRGGNGGSGGSSGSSGNEGRSDSQQPVLKRTVVRPGGAVDGADSAFVTDRLTTLTHELANLLDGSMRCLSLARRTSILRSASAALASTQAGAQASNVNLASLNGHAADNNLDAEPDLDLIRRHLETVHSALQQMAHLVKSSMSGFTPGLMAPINLSMGSCGALGDAVRHAVEVMQPVALDHHIRLVVDVDPRLSDIPAGPVYTVVSSGVRNAIESIQRAWAQTNDNSEDGTTPFHTNRRADRRSPAPIDRLGERGVVHILASLDEGVTPEQVLLEIIDDGEGPPSGLQGGTDKLFEFGVSSKPRGGGVGLAVTQDVINELGGSVSLRKRQRNERTADTGHSARPGAVLSVRFPCPPSADPATGDR